MEKSTSVRFKWNFAHLLLLSSKVVFEILRSMVWRVWPPEGVRGQIKIIALVILYGVNRKLKKSENFVCICFDFNLLILTAGRGWSEKHRKGFIIHICKTAQSTLKLQTKNNQVFITDYSFSVFLWGMRYDWRGWRLLWARILLAIMALALRRYLLLLWFFWFASETSIHD